MEQYVRSLDAETLCGYYVSAKAKRIWNVELGSLVKVQDICRRHGLTYYAVAGTLLGAIRHGGFIPWDDDIDIGMPRTDYERFCEVAANEIEYPLFLQTYKTERYYSFGWAKLRNSLTTGFTSTDAENDMNKGLFIDIFPVDDEPQDDALRMKENRWNVHTHGLNDVLARKWPRQPGTKGVVWNFLNRFIRPFVSEAGKERLVERRTAEVSKHNGESTEWCGLRSFSMPDQFRWKRADCSETVNVPFEGIEIAVPIGYEAVLDEAYGNWREFVRGGSQHEGSVMDPDAPFESFAGSDS